MILKSPPKGWKRPVIPVAVKLQAMLRRYPNPPITVICQGSDSAKMVAMFLVYGKHHFHHSPGLWQREFDTDANDTDPKANSAEHILAVTGLEHDAIENGPGGERRITSAGSASNQRAKNRRLNKPKKSRGPKLRSRGFDKTRSRRFDGTVTRRKR
jgi:hypothetical protein